MFPIGDLKDPKMAEAIVKRLQEKGIEGSIVYRDEEAISTVVVSREEDIPAAIEVYRVTLGFPAPPKVSQEWVEIKQTKMGYVTKFFFFSSISFYFILMSGKGEPAFDSFAISAKNNEFFFEVKNGEFWRLFTPALLHFNFFHILFNMMWLRDLGAIFEKKFGGVFLLIFILLSGVLSNILQYFVNGPYFGGMSGVVYGLLALLVTRQLVSTNESFKLPKHDIILMIVWFILCLFDIFGPIANMAHGGGLLVGAIFGIALSLKEEVNWSKAALVLSVSVGLLGAAYFTDNYKNEKKVYYKDYESWPKRRVR